MSILKKIFGDENLKALKKIQPIVDTINSLEAEIKKMPAEAFPERTALLRARLGKGETEDDILPEAFALVREAALRTLGERHYDVQLIGGIILHQGKIAEMRTGEGKTLVATLPSYLNALSGKGVHVVTVNDYLARRDAVWMGQIFAYLGVSSSVINHDSSYIYDPKHVEADEKRDDLGSFKIVYDFLRPCTRKEAYLADITYGTNSEFGFDYLRDNIAYNPEQLAQRGYNFALVDEIDSILIDEARTPLIISSATADSEDLYVTFANIANKLSEGEDYEVDEKLKAVSLTDAGITKAERALGVENIYTEKGIKYVHHLETAVRAKALFKKDKEYVVKDNEVMIVDEFTGRVQPGRRWSEGLHQAIEAKEGAKIQKESRTVASITYQNYFRLYKKLSGMTGTAMTSSEEFYKVYGLEVITAPTNKPSARIDRTDLIFQTETGKFTAIARKVRELHDAGQPVLIGTASIEKNELLSIFLEKEGIPHEVLNAKKHEQEGEIIAQSGRRSSVVIATNMAGRGVDIKLGGNPHTQEEYENIKELGGLYVIGTERHEARRIDNQLRGRSGRQGDPGETQFYVSLEDSLMRVFASDMIKKMMGRFGIPEDEAIQNPIISKSLETAQEKIEGFHFDSRKQVLEYDDVMSHQRKIVYERRRKMLLADKEYVLSLSEELAGLSGEAKEIMGSKKSALGEEIFLEALRRIALQSTDMLWMDHLEMMDYLRNSVRLRAYGQRDPLVEYKKEGLRLFREMEDEWRNNIVEFVKNINTDVLAAEERRMEEAKRAMERAIIESGAQEGTGSLSIAPKDEEGKKIGRNDPCWCGSGKKFKHCHGA
ncbi:MAG: preprotein translocase subunit SecA [Candidatus Paceibacterota bacterium]|jgi:preprotein translocase subunit SecA|nr:preprotein translocase subunit SecA [Candidatus Paceibacterota bacterium]